MEPVVHNTIQTFDEAVEVLHLLCHVLVVLQSLMILPGCGKWKKGKREEGVRV